MRIPALLFLVAIGIPAGAQNQVTAADFAGLGRYRDENARLSRSDSGRVVFMGNSITEGWAPLFPRFFPGRPYVGRGIGGQTTAQMLLRFRQDVIALAPAAVVILAGTNDIAGNTGPATLEEIRDNIASMVDLARANGVRVLVCSVLPVYDYPWKPGLEPAARIITLNTWLKEYAEAHGAAYVDLHGAMQDERHGLRAEYTYDGVHLTDAGYGAMSALVDRALSAALP